MLFAFGLDDGTYYASHGTNRRWHGLPEGLRSTLEDIPILESISFGDGGAYFWRSKGKDGRYEFSASTFSHYPGLESVSDPLWVAFGPDGDFLCQTISGVAVSSSSMFAAIIKSDEEARSKDNTSDPESDVHYEVQIQPDVIEPGANQILSKQLRSASFGYDGAWVIVEIDGSVHHHGLDLNVENKLKEKPVRKIQLSRLSPSQYFIHYIDGYSSWNTPSAWDSEIENIEEPDVSYDVPKNFHPPIVFSFGPEPNLFCVSALGVTKWKKCSKQLIELLREFATPSSVSMGEGGAFHWKMGRRSILSSETEFSYPEVWRIYKSKEPIKWVAFGPEGRYFVQTTKQAYASEQRRLIRTFGSGKQVPTLCASFGYGGSWVVVEGDDGTVRTHNVSRSIRNAILRKSVRHVHLSQTDPNHYFVEYRDHTTSWSLPDSWHQSVQSVEKPSLLDFSGDSNSSEESPPQTTSERVHGTSTERDRPFLHDDFSLGAVRCLTGLVHRYYEPVSARGGYSDVFRGKLILHQGGEEEEVAMKVLRATNMSNRAHVGLSVEERLRKRMIKETEIWCRLDHPCVVPLRGFAIEDEIPVIISPWFEHGNVHQYLATHPEADRKNIVQQVAEGLLYLHSQDPSVVHGDLKGGNVLINKNGDAALCDFGLSTLLMANRATTTMSTAALGTVRWCAPELLTANLPEKTKETDIWAFGVLALEILTGHIPFHKCQLDAKVVIDIANGKTPARSDHPELPAEVKLWQILESCWEQAPAARPTINMLKSHMADDQNFDGYTDLVHLQVRSRLNHPHVVSLRNYVLQEDSRSMVMRRWFENGDVHSYLDSHPEADRKQIVRQIAEGLFYLHSQNPPVLHGSLCGANVLINKDRQAALYHFGRSASGSVGKEMLTLEVETVRWCAPELLTSDVPERTQASDVWAFAALALEILTGRIPFHTYTNDAKVIRDIVSGKIPAREDYTELHPDCRFWDILEPCWRYEPSARPTMAELKLSILDDQAFALTDASAANVDSSDPFTLGGIRCLTKMIYRYTEPLSSTGHRDVFRGKLKIHPDSDEEEDVAMKALRAVRTSNRAGLNWSSMEEMRKRMNRELEIWSRLDHANIVPLRGYALLDDGTPTLVSPWFENGDAHSYLELRPQADRKKIVQQVAQGLIYLHAQEPPVVHGNLKGGNVLIAGGGDAAICDFSLSALPVANLASTRMSTVDVGSLRWCAPELLTSDAPERTTASDVWAFAALVLEIFTGRIPFHTCTNDAKVIQNIVSGRIPAREDYPELHPDSRLWEILKSCWQEEPSDRPTMENLKPLILDDQTFTPNWSQQGESDSPYDLL